MMLAIADWIQTWIGQYGYVAIFMLLMLGIVGLPLPDETLMTYVGYLCSRGELALPPAIIAAMLGSACGITLSYFLGRTSGAWFVRRFGAFLHITPQRMLRIHAWFERFGRWTLVVGYFIPGVRHLTAFAAGTSRLELPVFCLFAYSGAVMWSNAFILTGYFLGQEWRKVGHRGHLIIAASAAALLLAAGAVTYLIHRRARRRRADAPTPPPPPA
jgi:membrane protein DedA with SNARE-associated domain